MAGRVVLIDTGPLVASLSRRDHHTWAVEEMSRLRRPLVTGEAVLSEAGFLLSSVGLDPALPLDAVARGALIVQPVVAEVSKRIASLMRTYANLPMSLADAALVGLAEAAPEAIVFTTDSDFHVYRQRGSETIPLLFPPT